ncbi:MAG: phosphatidate cytidylyltransferase [Kiloniellales bacterium]|nr:phosphatidate cytidylyltransferase [Kiloniellales bacterium]
MRFTSSSSATGGTVQRLAPADAGNLTLRIVSALLLGPSVLLLTFLGWPYFGLMATVLAGVLAWEWSRICGAGELTRAGYLSVAAVVAALSAASLGELRLGGWIVLVGAMGAAVLGRSETVQDRVSIWYASGVVYAALPAMALVWLRGVPEQGLGLVLWLLFAVWATDIGAYAAGRGLGGPKLAPRLSPNKTWAGLGGAVVSSAAVGAAAGALVTWSDPLALAALSAVLALVAQGGDLFESWVKRHFGVKDSSNLIAGHGGFMDRLDGVLAAGLFLTLIVWAKGGSF